MKKKILGCLFIIILSICFVLFNTKEKNEVYVQYNGNNLKISIDGVDSSTLPTTGTYYLVSYDCKSKNTVVTWNKSNYTLSVSNGNKKAGVACDLVFESKPKLSSMPVGSYVAYTGSGGYVGSTSVACQTNGNASSSTASDETEAPNSCSGQNAREDLDTSGYTYGYCYSSNNKYYTTGWRIAYIKDNKPIIVSAGSPECNTRTNSTNNVTYIQTANAKALKYCNIKYVDDNCTCTDSNGDGLCDEASTDAWAINDTDFYYMTKAISGYGKRLTSGSSSLGDSGGALGNGLSCYQQYSYQECGYNNDLIDNGGFYWFAAVYQSSSSNGVNWYPLGRYVYFYTYANPFGLRPVISLSSSVLVTGGSGTLDDPYTIGNNTFWINNGASTVSNANKSSVNLTMMTTGASKMCISTNTSVCTNYVTYSDSYTLNWSSESAGEKVVYVYYKDNTDRVIASMNRSITLLAS